MDADLPTKGIYLDLDCLYDTRLAVLEEIDPDVAIEALSRDYNSREEDIFPFITKEQFTELYELRDEQTLEKAMLSNAVVLLKNFINDANAEIGKTPFNTETQVYLNVYPFKIDYTTATNMIIPLQKMCGVETNIQIINYDLAKLTPNFISSKIDLMLMYNYGPWLDIHAQNGNFKRNQIPNKTLYVPKIYFNQKPSEEELQEIIRETKATPFKTMEFMAAGIVGLEFIDIINFNAALPENAVEEFKKRFDK